jgi:multiple sugar transport system permease protein
MTTDTDVRSPVEGGVGPAEPVRTRSRRRRIPVSSVVRHTVMLLGAFLMIYPLLWLVVSSFRPADEIFRHSGLFITHLDFENYTSGWNALARPFQSYLMNSAILVIGAIVGNLFSCSLAAYAFARLEFRGKKWMFGAMLLTIMIPIHVIIVPQYIFFSRLDLINTFVPLLLPKFLATDSFFVFLMVQFIRGIPRELDEAARVDGAGHPRIFLKIILPLMTPALAATAIFTFIWTWNDFFSALIFLTDADVQTVPVALRSFIDASGSSNFGGMFAMSIVSLFPVFLVFLFGQKYLVKGIATTGLK